MSVDPNSSNNISDLISIEGLAIAKFSRSVFKEMQRGKITAANCTCCVWENFNETIGKVSVWNDHFKINSDILAVEALSILEKNNISALPVLDKSKIKGIVTMQDIIKSIN